MKDAGDVREGVADFLLLDRLNHRWVGAEDMVAIQRMGCGLGQ